MADENAWDEALGLEEAPPAAPTEQPVESATEVPNEAIDRADIEPDGTQQEATGEEPEQDPDAWRTVRFDEDPSSIHKMLMELSEKSPAVKRALASAGSLRLEREHREKEQEWVARLEELERQKEIAELTAGNLSWGRMSAEQRGQHLAKNPQDIAQYNNWVQLAQKMQRPPQQSPAWIRTLVNDAHEILTRRSMELTEEEEAVIRNGIRNPQNWAQFSDAPYRALEAINSAIDEVIQSRQNGAVQVDATPRSPAPVGNGSRNRNESRVQASPANSGLGKFAPDATPRSGSSGGSRTYTRAEIDDMDVDDYTALLTRHNAKTGQELQRRGIIVD